jgi:hypothetical protein
MSTTVHSTTLVTSSWGYAHPYIARSTAEVGALQARDQQMHLAKSSRRYSQVLQMVRLHTRPRRSAWRI